MSRGRHLWLALGLLSGCTCSGRDVPRDQGYSLFGEAPSGPAAAGQQGHAGSTSKAPCRPPALKVPTVVVTNELPDDATLEERTFGVQAASSQVTDPPCQPALLVP